jgi:hypothetical protein
VLRSSRTNVCAKSRLCRLDATGGRMLPHAKWFLPRLLHRPAGRMLRGNDDKCYQWRWFGRGGRFVFRCGCRRPQLHRVLGTAIPKGLGQWPLRSDRQPFGRSKCGCHIGATISWFLADCSSAVLSLLDVLMRRIIGHRIRLTLTRQPRLPTTVGCAAASFGVIVRL